MGFGIVDLFQGRKGYILSTLGGAWFMVLGTRLVFPALLPYVKEDFGVSNAMVGAVLSLIWICYSLMQFPSGMLTDHLGERRLLIMSMAIASVSMLLVAVPSWVLFVAGAVLFGSGTGLFGPPRVTILEQTYSEGTGSALGFVFALGNLGTAILPPVAGLVALSLGWRWGFLILGAPMLLFVLLLWQFIPSGGNRSPGSFASASLRDLAGDLRDGLLDRSVLLAGLGLSLGIFSYQGLTSFLPYYLIHLKQLPEATASVLFGVFFAAGAFLQLVSGVIADRIGVRLTLMVISLLAAFALVWFVEAQGSLHLVGVLSLMGVRTGIGPVANGYLVTIIPDRIRGTVYGMVRTLCLFVGSMGSLMVGSMADAGFLRGSFLVLAGLTGVMGLAFACLKPSG